MPFNKYIYTSSRRSKLTLSIFLFILPLGCLIAQDTNSPVSSGIVRLELNKLFGVDQRLISGDFYHSPRTGSISGQPYFFNEEWKKGSVTMDGFQYNDLMLKFDIASNTIVLNTNNQKNTSILLCLKKEKISEFIMDGEKFIRYPNENDYNDIVFAQLCSEGKVDFLLVRAKELVITDGGFTTYKYKNYYQNYLRYNGEIVQFKSRKTLYKMFPELKSDLKKYLSQNNLSTKIKETANRTMLVNYCNALLSD